MFFRSALLALTIATVCSAQTTQNFDVSIPSGRNFDRADFRLWMPQGLDKARAVAVLLTGSNGDGRPQVDDPVWQSFATRNGLALLGVRLTDKPHDQSFIEEYVNVSQGSGQALLDAIDTLAKQSQHAELSTASLLFWGCRQAGSSITNLWRGSRSACLRLS